MSPSIQRSIATVEQWLAFHKYFEFLVSALDRAPQVHATGHFDTIIAAKFVDASAAAAALPDGVTLVADERTPSGQHPLLLALGAQSDVKVLGEGPLHYGETIIGVPNVSVDGFEDKGLAMYVSRIAVDHPLAWLLGKFIGLPKDLDMIHAGADDYSVRTLLARELVLSETSQTTTDPKMPADFPNFAYVESLLQQPIVSVDLGAFLFITFQWHFLDAQLQGANSRLHVPSDLPALPAGDYSFEGFEKEVMGAGRLQVDWDLRGPFFEWPPPA